jgi:uncharacterized protein (DUF433 family)
MGVKEEVSRGPTIGPARPNAIMRLMDFSRYIDFDDPDGPKLIGHRIWLHDIIWQIVAHNFSDLQLLEQFPTLNREKVLAALLYFEQHREQCMHDYEVEVARREANAEEWREKNRDWIEDIKRRREAFKQRASS